MHLPSSARPSAFSRPRRRRRRCCRRRHRRRRARARRRRAHSAARRRGAQLVDLGHQHAAGALRWGAQTRQLPRAAQGALPRAGPGSGGPGCAGCPERNQSKGHNWGKMGEGERERPAGARRDLRMLLVGLQLGHQLRDLPLPLDELRLSPRQPAPEPQRLCPPRPPAPALRRRAQQAPARRGRREARGAQGP